MERPPWSLKSSSGKRDWGDDQPPSTVGLFVGAPTLVLHRRVCRGTGGAQPRQICCDGGARRSLQTEFVPAEHKSPVVVSLICGTKSGGHVDQQAQGGADLPDLDPRMRSFVGPRTQFAHA